MRLDGFVTCYNSDGAIVGLQFFLSDTPYLGQGYAKLLNLDPIGVMTGDCGSFRFPAPVTGVKAASKKNKGIQGLEFYYADKVAKVGDMDGWKVNTQSWSFTEENALMGVYGEESPNGIEKLGMITQDWACQTQRDAEAAAAAAAANQEPVYTLTEAEEPVQDAGPLGLSIVTWGIIAFGLVAFCVLMNLTLCALRKGFGKKEDITVTTVTQVAPDTKKERRSRKKTTPDIENNIENSSSKLAGPRKYPQVN